MKKKTFRDVFLIVRKNRVSWLLLVFTFLISGSSIAQTTDVKGIVKTNDGIPMPGVNVVVKNSTGGVITGNDGSFSLSVPKDAILQFSFVGYEKQELAVGNQTFLSIVLIESTESLKEIVVVGYGTQRKSDLTGALVSVKSEDIEKAQVTTTDQALQGRAAGVTVTTNSGSPGTPVQIRVRGVGTINDASPLFVVDGFPLGDISFLNPSDIASMEILKDASSTAIYGSRGANGVIMITTKGGKAGGNQQISFDSYYGVSRMWKKPAMCNASQWAMLNDEAQTNAGNPLIPELVNYQSLGAGTDWVKEVTRTARTSNVNFSVMGSNDKLTYFLSANRLNQEGIVRNSSFERISARLNTSMKVKKWFTLGENLTLETTTTNKINEADEWNSILIQAITLDPVTPVRRPNGYFSASDYVQSINPVAHLTYGLGDGDRVVRDIRMVGNVYVDIAIWKGLSFKSNLGLDYTNEYGDSFVPTYELYNSSGPVDGQSNLTAKVSKRNTENKSWSWSNYFNYTLRTGKHNVALLAGMESSRTYSNFFNAQRNNLLSNESYLGYFDNSINPIATAGGSISEKKMLSFFGRLNYDYNEKYLLTFNIRRDGSSIFGPNDRYGVFPAFSLGWKINKEDFFSDIKTISNMKLRAGWGQVGNDKIPEYGYYTDAKTGRPYVYNNTIVDGVTFPQPGNPDLHWETTATTNLGVDLGLWQDKVSLSAEYYIKKTSNMLVQVPVAGDAGLEVFPFQNIGKMENRGFEMELSLKNTIQDFSYDLGLNMSTFKNKVTGLGGEDAIYTAPLRNGGNVSVTQVGGPVSQFFGYKTSGLFQTATDVQNWKDNDGNLLQPNAQPGDIRYAKGADGQLYQGVIGNPLPKFTYGFNARFNYKGFDLDLFFQGVHGNKVFNGTMVYSERTDAAQNLDTRMLNRWTGPNTTNDAHFPRLNAADANNLYFSDRFVEDGSYLRLKNLQFGYTLPKELLQRVNIQKLRFYLGGTNLLTFTKYTGFDPEIGAGYFGSLDQGIDRATYPQARTFTVGLNLTF